MKSKWGSKVLYIKWRVLQITVSNCLNYLPNCNKQVFKINFKPLLKWTFPKTNVVGFGMTNNFCVQSFSSCHTKMGEKFEFRSVWYIFKYTQVLNFYLSNEVSNEKVPKTKVVDLEILYNFCIQKFFIWGHIEGEKLNLQTEF